jgi:hypothetical protein
MTTDNLPRANEKLVGLKINLRDTHFMIIQLPESKVQQFVQAWANGAYKGRIVNGPSIGEITYWAFNGDDVVGMHTLLSASLGHARGLPTSPTGFGPLGPSMSGN